MPDFHRPIFWLISGSLILDIASYLILLFMARGSVAAFFLEISYLLTPHWAVPLVIQFSIFRRASHFDRSRKFIRASYGWPRITIVLIPLLVPYHSWTGEGLSHVFWSA